MRQINAVIGSSYGDEGKGLFTDYLSHLDPGATVVRFNGGNQAGHTVNTPDGKHHIFSSFGAGSFVGNNSFLSSFFVFNPFVFKKEKYEFNKKSLLPNIYINKNAYLSTPFDIILNQAVEIKRDNERHGSCGLGFGETIERCEKSEYLTNMMALKYKDFFWKQLNNIQENYLKYRATYLNIWNEIKSNYQFILSKEFIEKIYEDYLLLNNEINISDDILPKTNLIFEGAQGLLLDQDIGFFPHVTRSNTGLKNIVSLLDSKNNFNNIEKINVIYATRCYTTRHGAGPLKNELKEKPYENIIDTTNIKNDYQGILRFAYIDLNVLSNTIQKDILISNIQNKYQLDYKIGVSCLDQTDYVYYYLNDKLYKEKSENFCNVVANFMNCSVLSSYGKTRNDII